MPRKIYKRYRAVRPEVKARIAETLRARHARCRVALAALALSEGTAQ